MTNKSVFFRTIILIGIILAGYGVSSVAVTNPQTQINKASATIAKEQAEIAKNLQIITTSTSASAIKKAQTNIIKSKEVIAKQQTLITELKKIITPAPTVPVPTVPSPTVPSPTTPPEPPKVSIAGTQALQNMTNYNFVLTQVALYRATCTPACTPQSILNSRAIQNYALGDSTGYVTLDYDVNNGTTYIGHFTLHITASATTVTNGLGATLTQQNQTAQVNYVQPTPYWSGQFTSPTNWLSNNWKFNKSLPNWGAKNIEVKTSNTTAKSPKGDNYLRIRFPAGSANSGASPPLPLGGTQFYGAMINTSEPVTLSFYLLFPTNFPFKRPDGTTSVGKLPGLYGGIGNTGRVVPTGSDGWSTRFMWCDYIESSRKKVVGGGQLLQFTVNSNQGLYGHDYGTSLGCNSFTFVPDGKWHNLQQTIHLNDVGKANGRIDVCFDGRLVFSQQNITFRTTPSLQINGILFQTFFGGSGATYATPIDTYADFANFALYLYPPSLPPGLCITNP